MAPIVGRFGSLRGGRDGAIAQLGERVVRNDEVGGSIPPGSTTLRPSGRRPAYRKNRLRRLRQHDRGRRRQPALDEILQPSSFGGVMHRTIGEMVMASPCAWRIQPVMA